MKRRKLLALLVGTCLVLVLAALPFMAACAKPAPAPAPAPTPAPAPAPVAPPAPVPAPKVWELRYGSDDPPTFPYTIARDKWCKMVEEATKGRVKVTQYHSMTLYKPADAWSGVVTGIGDIMSSMTGYYPGQFPLSDIMTLPLLSSPKGVTNGLVTWRLIQQFPAMQAEYTQVKLIGYMSTDTYYLVTTGKPVRTLADIKGLKLRAPGGPPTDMTKALGAVPLSYPMPDTYLALQKGTIDGMWEPALSTTGFRHYEVVKYYTKVPTFCIIFPLAMNLARWNSLPPDIQQQIMSVSGEKFAELLGKCSDDAAGTLFEDVKKAGYVFEEVITPSPEELQKFVDIGGKPIWDAYVEKWKDKGPTRDILNRAVELVKELSK